MSADADLRPDLLGFRFVFSIFPMSLGFNRHKTYIIRVEFRANIMVDKPVIII